MTSTPASDDTSPPAAEPVQPLDPPVQLRFAVAGTVGEAGIYIAAERGYFEDEGLEVELIEMRRFADALPLLATGRLELATGGINPDVWNAIDQGVPVQIVGAHVTGVPGTAQSALVVAQSHLDDGTYEDLSSLAGMKIGINSLGSSSEYYIENILEQGGLTESDIELVVMGFADMPAAMANGSIDAAFTVEPFINNMRTSGLGQSVITTTEAVPGSIGSVIVIGPDFAEQTEAANRAMYAFLRGQREYLDAFINGENPEGRDEIIDILTRHTSITDPAVFEGMGMSGGDPSGEFDLVYLTEFQDYFLEQGTIERALDPNDMVNFSFLDYANERLAAEDGS